MHGQNGRALIEQHFSAKVALKPNWNMKARKLIRRIIFRYSLQFPKWHRLFFLALAFVHPSTSRAQAGFIDPSFLNGMSGPNSWVWAVALQSDGKLLVGGQFTGFNGVPRNQIVRVNTDGSADTNFSASVTAGEPTVHSLAVQPDGKVLIGGMFSGVDGATRIRLACVNADGTLDSNFVASATSSQSFITVSHIALQTNSQIVIAGWFETVNGSPHTNIARLNNNGTLDTAFTTSIDTPPNALALQADGRVLIGGAFSAINGQLRSYIACLNTNGTLDTSFTTTTDGNVDSFAVQPDGKTLIAGNFNTVNTQARHHIARLNPNGSLDTNFQNGMAGADSYVGCVAYDPTGKVLIGGQFSFVNGVGRTNVARLNTNGSLDTNFLANVDSFLELVLIQPDSRLIIEGSYITSVDGRSRNRIARLQSSGAPVVSPPVISTGAFAFGVNAVAGKTYGVEVSTNLVNWSLALSTNATTDNFTFRDPAVTQFPRRFFRVYESP